MVDIVLKMHYKVHFVEVLVKDTDRTLIIDVYNDMIDAVEEENIEWPENLSLAYSFNSRSVRLRSDNDLMEMFQRLEGKKVIDLCVGFEAKPCHALLMAREFRSYAKNGNVDEVEGTLERKKQGKTRAKLPVKRPISTPSNEVIVISPRKSGRLNTWQGSQHTPPAVGSDEPIEHPSPAHLSTPPTNNAVISPRRSVRMDTSQVPKTSPAAVVSVQPNQPASSV
ncbi:hypothetical protein RND81_13G105500 [Saponaria officinalis]|uniref:Uncharacterized protein n=1 Tax=Saponaria officinalis TaxID=3572 RepID=A0AAW1H0W5_SAPOF